jgi:hypothetical protein
MGRCDLKEEIAAGQLSLAGNPALIRAFPDWFTWSNFSPTVRAARTAA